MSQIMKPRVLDMYWLDNYHDGDYEKCVEFGLWGVIHKTSQGAKDRDKLYAAHRKAAKATGLLYGAYHFGTGDNVKDQIDNFLLSADPDENTLLALDYETIKDNSMNADQLEEFLALLFMRTGQLAKLYGGDRLRETMPNPPSTVTQHDLWLCEYGPVARLPKGWSKYFLWQYAADGDGPQPHNIPGTHMTNCDLNVVPDDIKSKDDLAKVWMKPVTPAVAPPTPAAVPKSVIPPLVVKPAPVPDVKAQSAFESFLDTVEKDVEGVIGKVTKPRQ